MTQNQMILEHLQTGGSITSLEAMNEYGIMRLASRISDLKHRGYNISDEWVNVPNRRKQTCKVKRYTLAQETDS